MLSLYETTNRILTKASVSIREGLYSGAQQIYDNIFFESALTLAVIIFGFMYTFRRFDNEETVYKIFWTLLVFTFVKTVLINYSTFEYFTTLLRLPFDIFMKAVGTALRVAGGTTETSFVIDSIMDSNIRFLELVRSYGSYKNLFPFFYSLIIWLVGTFLMVTIIMMILVSTFLADLVLALAPLILPTLIFAKTQNVFFQWLRLYISLSLYAPFTLLFGVALVEVNKLIQQGAHALEEGGFAENTGFILVVIVAQIIIVLSIYRIPNIINQIIGSSNEGSSLSGSVGTASAGVTLLMGAARYSGLGIASKGVTAGARGSGRKILEKGTGGMGESGKSRVTIEPH